MSHIVSQLSSNDMETFFKKCSTISAYMIFPSKQVDRKMTINAARGVNSKIQDRFDLTLECIRRFYNKEESPLTVTLERYTSFFNLFQDFKGYIDFFLLHDLVNKDYSKILYWHPFVNFDNSPMPKNLEEFSNYRDKVMSFITKRNQRILMFSKTI